MRSLFIALLASTAPAALFAAPVALPATVTAVTLFPEGAQVTRTVAVPAGGEILVPNLPDGTDPAGLRVTGTGLAIGAVTLIDERQPAAEDVVSPALAAARANVADLTEALAAKQDGIAQIRAKAEAARAKVEFLKGLDTANTAPADIAKLAQTVAEGVLAANGEAIAAEAEVRRAEVALQPDRDALETAQKALAALEHPEKGSDSLLVTATGAGTLTITTFVQGAGWTPSYDLRLDGTAGRLAIDRFVSVRQATGEDWTGVDLTLSTARPSDRTDPSELWPQLLRIGPEQPVGGMAKSAMREADSFAMPVAEAAPMPMTLAMQGETVTYRYATPVDIRDGVENLRLGLDTLERPAKVLAEAVPARDDTAYRVAEGTNTGVEALLPGPATLFVDGAVVGTAEMPAVAAGAPFRFGFGAIDGLRLKRLVPEANEGDRGLISKSNERREVAQISVENLSGRDWPVRLIDQVPYSEQEDLKIDWTATPAPTATDWTDKRGLLAWEFDLAAGKTQAVKLETTIRWPADQVLQ